MKKISIALLALATAGLAASCQKEETVEQGFTPMTISAVTEGIETQQTKAEMAYKYDVLWNEGDKISVKNSSESAEFTLTDGAGTTKGTFTSSTSISGDVEAYYPASVANLVWPSVQHNNEVCPMYCKKTLSGTTDERMDFASLGSVLQIVFNTTQANVILMSIEITDGEKTMSGAFTVDMDGKANITATDKAGITLDLGTGVALGKGAKYFNIAVPAGNYEDLTLVFTAKDGAKCTMTGGRVNIACNTVGRLTLTGETFKPDVPEGALPGEFSVSATKTVHFSQGNLWADGSNALHFESNQYSSASSWDASHVSHFTWSDNITSAVSNSNSGSNLFCDENHKVSVDGGDAIYYALSKDEWAYLLNNHTKKWASVNGKSGYVIAPDGFTGELASSYADDAALASAGNLVFLPAAGSRDGSDVRDVGDGGNYWSSTAYDEHDAYSVLFISYDVYPDDFDFRNFGFSVRLITECQ